MKARFLAAFERAWRAVQDFFRWWIAELSGLVPPGVTALLARRADSIGVELNADGLALSARRTGDVGPTFLSFDPPIALADALRAMNVESGAMVSLVVDRLSCHCFELILPAVSEDALRSAVEYQLEVHSPLPVNDIVFSAKAKEGEKDEKGRRAVQVVIAKKNACEKWAAEVGVFEPRSVLLVAPSGEDSAGGRIDLSRLARPKAGSWGMTRPMLLAASACVLLIAVPLLTWVMRDQAISELIDERRSLESETERLIAIDRSIHRLQSIERTLAQTYGPSYQLDLVDRLSSAIDKGSWIFLYQFDGRELRLEGVSADPQAVAGALQAMPTFDEVAIERTVREQGDGASSRFVLTAKIGRRDD